MNQGGISDFTLPVVSAPGLVVLFILLVVSTKVIILGFDPKLTPCRKQPSRPNCRVSTASWNLYNEGDRRMD